MGFTFKLSKASYNFPVLFGPLLSVFRPQRVAKIARKSPNSIKRSLFLGRSSEKVTQSDYGWKTSAKEHELRRIFSEGNFYLILAILWIFQLFMTNSESFVFWNLMIIFLIFKITYVRRIDLLYEKSMVSEKRWSKFQIDRAPLWLNVSVLAHWAP